MMLSYDTNGNIINPLTSSKSIGNKFWGALSTHFV